MKCLPASDYYCYKEKWKTNNKFKLFKSKKAQRVDYLYNDIISTWNFMDSIFFNTLSCMWKHVNTLKQYSWQVKSLAKMLNITF